MATSKKHRMTPGDVFSVRHVLSGVLTPDGKSAISELSETVGTAGSDEERQCVTALPQGVGIFELSPDGSTIASTA